MRPKRRYRNRSGWLRNYGGIFDLEGKSKRLEELEIMMENPAVWNDPKRMESLSKEKSRLSKEVSEYHELVGKLADAEVLLELAVESQDETHFQEAKVEILRLADWVRSLELKKVLNAPEDSNNCYLTLNAGAGGTEACDWAMMLMRMYMRYANKKHWNVEVEDINEGEGAGIKSATLFIEGSYAYGYLKGESGVHRLVRISPFDANARRHTSFASVFVYPEVGDDIKIEIRPEDIRVETFRSSGAGGQHVNRTDSAVRMYHIPTGIVVACQTQRSQIQNRERALKMLKAALYQRELEQREKVRQELEATKKANEWGSQIRSYVLHPYRMVKDNRTDFETSQADEVLDGELEGFIRAYLKQKLQGNV
ncbi:MAG: peptide chain release factor 2 [Bdellovibrionaceae bacterium]|nr:peptide chain release factor 2 [Pseudobdellovibrionaceae bacterium]MDW8189675.1 peptide chain release factor 2 [Pseudobdellovibrionaceae bacterium]